METEYRETAYTSHTRSVAQPDLEMETAVTVGRVGDSLALILPQSMVDALNVKEGDELRAVSAEDGLFLTKRDAAFESAMEDAREFMRTHAAAFRALAR